MKIRARALSAFAVASMLLLATCDDGPTDTGEPESIPNPPPEGRAWAACPAVSAAVATELLPTPTDSTLVVQGHVLTVSQAVLPQLFTLAVPLSQELVLVITAQEALLSEPARLRVNLDRCGDIEPGQTVHVYRLLSVDGSELVASAVVSDDRDIEVTLNGFSSFVIAE